MEFFQHVEFHVRAVSRAHEPTRLLHLPFRSCPTRFCAFASFRRGRQTLSSCFLFDSFSFFDFGAVSPRNLSDTSRRQRNEISPLEKPRFWVLPRVSSVQTSERGKYTKNYRKQLSEKVSTFRFPFRENENQVRKWKILYNCDISYLLYKQLYHFEWKWFLKSIVFNIFNEEIWLNEEIVGQTIRFPTNSL